jgi:HlyD family secretion protein
MKKIILGVVVLAVVAVVLVLAFGNGKSSKTSDVKLVKVERGEIVEKAMAIGTIQPYKEIQVKSKISGIVKKLYVEIGDSVKEGALLIDIAPQPTPMEYTEAKRAVEIAQVNFDNAKLTYDRSKELHDKQLISESEYDTRKTEFDQSQLQLRLAQERLQLTEQGSLKTANLKVESTVRSPITGSVLSKNVNEGDPVVPLTSYQDGTALITLADMHDLIFRGTVDEIDVGKLKEGMPVTIKIGALPNDTVSGTLYKISPKARKQESATVFDVEVKLPNSEKTRLRAGYSANAEIIIKQAKDILTIPERVVDFRGDSAFVMVQDSMGKEDRRAIETGLSDGITIEVTKGVKEGETIAEKPVKKSMFD